MRMLGVIGGGAIPLDLRQRLAENGAQLFEVQPPATAVRLQKGTLVWGWQFLIRFDISHGMRSETSSLRPSSPENGHDFPFLLIDGFLTGCNIPGMFDDDEPETPSKYPNNIRKARKRKRWSLQETAHHSKMSFQTLQRWETKQPKLSVEKVAKLAKALECSPADLLPYHLELDDEEAFVLSRLRAASPAERRAIVKSVKGLTDRDEEAFELRPPPKPAAKK